MAKPKPPRWLTAAFADGVVELAPDHPTPAYKGALGECWLAQFDEHRRPCEGRLERAHLIPRQRIEHALYALLPHWGLTVGVPDYDKDELILLAAWDPRNGVVACQHHHRRLDRARMPILDVAYEQMPKPATEYACDWGLEQQLETRFPRAKSIQ